MRSLFLLGLLFSTGCGKSDDSSDGSTETGNDTGILDRDSDGWADDQDCDPDDPYTYPGADDIPYDGKDNDCCCETEGEDAACLAACAARAFIRNRRMRPSFQCLSTCAPPPRRGHHQLMRCCRPARPA